MDFFESFVNKCKHFFNTYILPGLMTRKLQCPENSPDINEQQLYCYCQMAEELLLLSDSRGTRKPKTVLSSGSIFHVLELLRISTVMKDGIVMSVKQDYVHDISSGIYIQIIIVLLTMYKATYLVQF